MITLNTEKDLIRISSVEEFEMRPAFRKDLNPKEHELKSIIASYHFKTKIPCGFSNCHTPHQKGYIITTEAGYETNIGHLCGKREFSVNFEALKKAFDRDLREKELREILHKFNRQLDSFRESELSIFSEATKVQKLCRALFHTGTLPTKLVNEVRRMVRDRSANIYNYRETTSTEKQLQQSSHHFQNDRIRSKTELYQREKVGEFKGLDILYPENDLRELLIIKLQNTLNEFSQLDIDNLNYRELKHWSARVGEAPFTLERIKNVIAKARTCFTKENLGQLEFCLDEYADQATLRDWIENLPELDRKAA